MAAETVGISATAEFWKKVDALSRKTGQSRSAVIVETCCEAWGVQGLVSKPVGRPKKHKGVKKVVKGGKDV